MKLHKKLFKIKKWSELKFDSKSCDWVILITCDDSQFNDEDFEAMLKSALIAGAMSVYFQGKFSEIAHECLDFVIASNVELYDKIVRFDGRFQSVDLKGDSPTEVESLIKTIYAPMSLPGNEIVKMLICGTEKSKLLIQWSLFENSEDGVSGF